MGSKIYVAGGLPGNGAPPINDMHSWGGLNTQWTTLGGFSSMENVLASSSNYQDAFWFIGGSVKKNSKTSPNSTVWAYAPIL